MHLPKLTFSALILVDPMIFPKPPSREEAAMTVDLAGGATKRRDIWESREDALRSLQSRASFKVWDPKVLELFVVWVFSLFLPVGGGLMSDIGF